MSLYQTRDGKWGVDFRDEWGRRHRKPVGRQEAAAVEHQINQQRREKRAALENFQRGATLTIEEAAQVYLAQVAASDYTRAHMQQRLSQFTRSIGTSELAQVTPALLARWQERRRQTLSLQTLWRDQKMYRAWFEWLRTNWYIPSNPWKVAGLQVPKPTETRARVLSYSEEADLLGRLTERTRLRVLLALDAGLSLAEVQSLRRNSLDLIGGTLSTLRHKTLRWRKSPRLIPLTERLREAAKKAAVTLAPDALVCSKSGMKLTKGNDFLRRQRQRGAPAIRFHDLRHTFATRLAGATANPFVVAALLGHRLNFAQEP